MIVWTFYMSIETSKNLLWKKNKNNEIYKVTLHVNIVQFQELKV